MAVLVVLGGSILFRRTLTEDQPASVGPPFSLIEGQPVTVESQVACRDSLALETMDGNVKTRRLISHPPL